jgi:hypothetical protein
LPPLIRAMLSPAFYPHPTSDPIALTQTHISYLLLTGTYAYKIKKPVDLGFLDFTTLERRRHFCQEEVRLNQRGAPGLYLGAIPITPYERGFRLDGPESAAVEYAVKMRQFDENGLFDRLVDSGRITDELIDRLARRVAEYHSGAATSAAIAEFGRPERIQEVINGNYRHTQRFVGSLQTPEQYQLTRTFTDRFFMDQRKVLEGRVAAGKIRECHGDLHLGNICFWERTIHLFDCIEFNELFRFVDVMQDAAFTTMDLESYQRADLANGFINAYAERTGDWQGLTMLPLYLVRHAYVRAKVNSLLSEEKEISPEARDKAMENARGYYGLAARFSQPRVGHITLVSGLSGSGKSTLGRLLARAGGAIHIRSDAVRKHQAGHSLDSLAAPETYSADMTERTYAKLLELGLTLAQAGFGVILDATYSKREQRMEVAREAKELAIPLRIVQCVAPANVLHDRLAARRGDISDAKPALLESQRQVYEPVSLDESAGVHVIDTSRPVDLDSLITPAARTPTLR